MPGPNKYPVILTGRPAKESLKFGKEDIAAAWAPITTNAIDVAIRIAMNAILFEFHLFIFTFLILDIIIK